MTRRSTRVLSALTVITVLGALGLGAVAGQVVVPANAASPVVVSLTFDDGTTDQLQAAAAMHSRGLAGTFYLNSGRLNTAGYMSTADALALQSNGHEVGGHTVSHVDLPTLLPDEQRRQICNDRSALTELGLQVTSLAYPFGDHDLGVEQVAAECGYNSARTVGGIVSPGSCLDCDLAETVPAFNAYAVRSPDSVKSPTTLQDMQNYVLQAQPGGGWVPLTFHHVCTSDVCDTYSVRLALLEEFLTWLVEQDITVRTVHQVVGGAVQPAIPGPIAPAPEDLSNLLRNPSLETDANRDGWPDCWQRGGYGVSDYSWSTTSDAVDGVVAQRVQVTSFTSGDRKLITQQDLGACAPTTRVGHTYRFAGSYKSAGQVRAVAYSRSSSGGWSFLGQGPLLAASTSYAAVSWTAPALPPGSTAISIGLSLRSTGFVQGDGFSLADTDQTSPEALITAPSDGNRVRGTVTFAADATDASGLDRVEFLVDGDVACTDTTAPFTCAYDTLTAADSVIAMTVRAVDTAGNVGVSPSHNYTVSNDAPLDAQAPTVSLTGPTAAATVSRVVPIEALATDDDAVTRVLFYVNGHYVGSDGSAPYATAWDSSTVIDGPVSIAADAVDRSGNVARSAAVDVEVANTSTDSTPPNINVTCDGLDCGAGYYRQAPTLELTASDAESGVAEIRYTTDGSAPTPTSGTAYSGPIVVTASTTVVFQAWDRAGNPSAARTVPLLVDTTAPTAAITSPAAGTALSGVKYIVAGVTDDVGVARVWFYLDGRLLGSRIVAPLQWKWDTRTVTKGAHVLHIVAADPAGNQTRSANIPVTVT